MNIHTDMGDPPGITVPDKRGKTVEVCLFHPADRGPLLRFYEDFQPKNDAQGLPPSHPIRIRQWINSILAGGLHLIARRDGELIGHAFVVPTDEPGIGEYAIFLREDTRGFGVGTALNRIAVDAARDMGWQGLWLTVEPKNRSAVRSYENAGFRFVRKTVFWRDAEMRLDLQQQTKT
ncbi:MAG: GNAT family N-acetyltransferase [Gemmatimonadota bacterium]|jgi:GNAT superfamily N-acetyltransferase|nr:GNAT family N-acetyltransferase [Gemmatimonadota bacterium]